VEVAGRCGIITGSQLLILIGQILPVCVCVCLSLFSCELDVLEALFIFSFFDVELRWVGWWCWRRESRNLF
jgi:hypothetical protein